MPTPPQVPAELTVAPFRGSDAVARGLLTPAQLRSGCWQRLLRDVYRHTDLPDAPTTRATAVSLVLPPGAVVAGRHAAWLHGVDIVDPRAQVQVCTRPGHATKRSGVAGFEAVLAPSDIAEIAGVAVTTPLRTAFDLARREPLTEAVVAVDALAHAALVEASALLALADEHRGRRGVRKVRRVVELHEPKSESPMESRMRMVVVLGGLDRPEAQVEVWTGSLLVARIDLAYRHARVGLEFDGREFHTGIASRRDDRRDNRLAAYGWVILRYDAAAVYQNPQMIVHQVRTALRAAA